MGEKIQNNLAVALQARGERMTTMTGLEEAIAAYRCALQELARERVPLEWAAGMDSLGDALQSLAEREGSAARLLDAVDTLRAALEERHRDQVPLQWADDSKRIWVSRFAHWGCERAIRADWKRQLPCSVLR